MHQPVCSNTAVEVSNSQYQSCTMMSLCFAAPGLSPHYERLLGCVHLQSGSVRELRFPGETLKKWKERDPVPVPVPPASPASTGTILMCGFYSFS